MPGENICYLELVSKS